MKLAFAFGTRPEVIKMAPIILKAKDLGHEVVICLSGQHQEMIFPFLKFFNLTPDYNIEIMTPGQTLTKMTSKAIDGFADAFSVIKPDMIFVQGDTTSTLSAALSGFYAKIPVAHVEAGLRTESPYSPFPEEMNRRITSQLSTYHFCPTERARQTLIKNNFHENIYVTGNTSIDALNYTLTKLKNEKHYEENILKKLDFIDCSKKIVLVTSHRRENLGKGQEEIFQALKKIHDNFEDIQIIFPVHLNPEVQRAAHDNLNNLERVFLIEPLDYVQFVWLMSKSYIILTDSGGIQEEAPHLGKPVIVLRNETERQEGIDAGTCFLAGTDKDKIYSLTENLLRSTNDYEDVAIRTNPYGDGKASELILKQITS